MLFPGGHAASICDNTPEAICRVLEEEEEGGTDCILFTNMTIAWYLFGFSCIDHELFENQSNIFSLSF